VVGNTAGSGTLSRGEISTFIETSQLGPNTLIFVTPSTVIPFPISVSEKIVDEGFRVEIPEVFTFDITFDWWIVDKISVSN